MTFPFRYDTSIDITPPLFNSDIQSNTGSKEFRVCMACNCGRCEVCENQILLLLCIDLATLQINFILLWLRDIHGDAEYSDAFCQVLSVTMFRSGVFPMGRCIIMWISHCSAVCDDSILTEKTLISPQSCCQHKVFAVIVIHRGWVPNPRFWVSILGSCQKCVLIYCI